MTISVVCWLWNPPGWTPRYSAEHVNALARMVDWHYDGPHRFVCVTNRPDGIDPTIEIVPDDGDFAALKSPEGTGMPACYRRLRMFRPDAARWFGDRFVSLDLDVVLTGNVGPLWDRSEDVVLYRDPLFPGQINGSMILLRAGARPQVWNDFDPERSPEAARVALLRGSDQAWISHCLPDEARWDRRDGVYSYRVELAGKAPPPDARLVVFHGNPKPWTATAPWIREYWRP